VIKVLHVEDEKDQATFLEIFLRETDRALRVDSVYSAEEALTRIDGGGYDCIVSDYLMSDIDGIQFAEQVKRGHDIPFIIYTGHGSEEVAQAAFAAGVDDYVRKEMNPSHYRVLAKSIRQAVGKKRAEDELRASLGTSSTVFSRLPSGMFIYRFEAPDRLFLADGNPEALRQTSMVREKVIGKEFDELWGPSGAELKKEYLQALSDGTQVTHDKLLWEGPHGSGYYRLSAFSIAGARLVVAFENISGQVRSDELYRIVYQGSPLGIETYNADGVVLDANPASLAYYGVDSVEDLRGWSIFIGARLSPEQRARLLKGEEVRVEAGIDFDEVGFPTSKKGVGHFEAVFKPFPLMDARKPPGYIGLVRDVTEVKASRERLREYAEQLRKAVDDRGRELLEAERMATAGWVSSMVGHDLRSPLQSIKNAAYMIKQKPELTPRMLEVIGGAVDRSLKMLDELRQRTREEPLTLEPTDLRLLVDNVAREISHPPNARIRVVSAEVPAVLVDSLRIRRVLENLMNNAFESMKTGGEVTVSLAKKDGHVELAVKDQGRGIAEDAKSQLFRPFYTTKPGGIGLGLAYCKRTVEAHGGTIRVESEEGKGTTATIRLPIGRQARP